MKLSEAAPRRPLTLIYPYYRNESMFLAQVAHLAKMPKRVRELLHLIVVDDGTPDDTALDASDLRLMKTMDLASVSLYRILVDVRWNWIAARNLAVHQAETEWVLMTDIDHMVPLETLHRIMFGDLDTRTTYRFGRVDAPDLMPYKPHPNSWLLTRKRFSEAGGYDERFSGFYGSDGEFRDRITAASRAIVILDQVLIRVPREVVADASTTVYGRKEPMDRDGVANARRKIAADPTPHRLTFPWERVA